MTTSNTRVRSVRSLLSALLGIVGFLSLSLSAFAQETGTITGQVFNPYTGQNVRYAEVSIVETSASATTDAEGMYRFNNIPVGQATVTLLFTGYEFQTVKVNVTAGGTVTQNFNLKLPASEVAGAKSTDDDIIQLSAFVVSGQREGSAKAIMEQRASQNISNVVAADAFGSVAEGNVGEFLKNMPGVDLDYVEADTRTPRLRGLPSQYTAVTMDGAQVASADAFTQFNAVGGGAGDGARSFGFEQVSINSIESIEVNKTAGADFDAEGAAGTINMKTKRAFDRQGRRISFGVNLTANSEEMNLNKSYGPDDKQSYKVLPGAMLEYSDIFLDNRLGIVLNVSESNSFTEQRRVDLTYNRTPTATDSRPVVLRQITIKDGPKTTRRSTVTLTADYKLSPKFDFGATYIWSHYDAGIYNRQYQFAASNDALRNTITSSSGNPLVNFGTSTAGGTQRSVNQSGNAGIKLTNTTTVNTRARYRGENVEVEAKGSYSHSFNDYEGIVRGVVRDSIVPNLTGTDFTATRSAEDSTDWKIVQTSGADWSDLTNFSSASVRPRIREEARAADVSVYTAQLDSTYVTNWSIPTKFKAGVKWLDRHNRAENLSDIRQYDYIGPVALGGLAAGNFALYPSRHISEHGSLGVQVISGNGGTIIVPDRNVLADLYKSRPDYFVPFAFSADNLYSARVANQRNFRESINAAYFMGTTTLKKLTLNAGLRFEATNQKARERNPYDSAEVVARGFTVGTAATGTRGRATTVDGIAFQYLSRPDIIREKDYDNLFASASAKYEVTRDFQLQAGFNQGIQRPKFGDVTGGIVREGDDPDATQVSFPNKDLKAETFNNYVTRAQYYFEPVGTLGLSVYQIEVKDAVSKIDYSASQFAALFPEESPFSVADAAADTTTRFRYKQNTPEKARFRGLEFEYSQQLSFLPGILRGIDVRTAYTRNYARVVNQSLALSLAPHNITGAIGFKYRWIYVNFSGKWTSDTPFDSVPNVATLGLPTTTPNLRARIREERATYDLNFTYNISNRYTISIQGRNIFNEPLKIYDPVNPITPALLWRTEAYGALWTAGFQAKF
jgi:iron complex outermembrane recepter protein